MTTASGLLQGFHKHHITPKFLGGNDSSSNLVLLHPIDHAIAHFVRWKMYRFDGDAWAYNMLKGFVENNGIVAKGMSHTEEAKIKIGIASATRKRKPHSEETKAKISAKKAGKVSNRKGVKLSEEVVEKMRCARIGQTPWNKGSVGVMTPWNRGKTGLQSAWNKGMIGVTKWPEEKKLAHSQRIKQIWDKRKQESL